MKAEKAESLLDHKQVVLVVLASISWSGDIWSCRASFHAGRTSTKRTRGPELLRIHLQSSAISAAAAFTWLHPASAPNLQLSTSGRFLQAFLLLPCGAAPSPERGWLRFGDAGSDVTLKESPELKSNHYAKKKEKNKKTLWLIGKKKSERFEFRLPSSFRTG